MALQCVQIICEDGYGEISYPNALSKLLQFFRDARLVQHICTLGRTVLFDDGLPIDTIFARSLHLQQYSTYGRMYQVCSNTRTGCKASHYHLMTGIG